MPSKLWRHATTSLTGTSAIEQSSWTIRRSVGEIADELARVQARLDEFEERLDAHLRDLGVADLSEDELIDLGLLKPPSPEPWFESK